MCVTPCSEGSILDGCCKAGHKQMMLHYCWYRTGSRGALPGWRVRVCYYMAQLSSAGEVVFQRCITQATTVGRRSDITVTLGWKETADACAVSLFCGARHPQTHSAAIFSMWSLSNLYCSSFRFPMIACFFRKSLQSFLLSPNASMLWVNVLKIPTTNSTNNHLTQNGQACRLVAFLPFKKCDLSKPNESISLSEIFLFVLYFCWMFLLTPTFIPKMLSTLLIS